MRAGVRVTGQTHRFLAPGLPDPQGRRGGIEHRPPSNEGDFMARIIVTADPTTDHAAPVLLDEHVYSLHLDSEHKRWGT
jgi:hypothetical protein